MEMVFWWKKRFSAKKLKEAASKNAFGNFDTASYVT